MSGVNEVISRMMIALGASTEAQMLEIMGLSSGVASQWKKRGGVPDGAIAKASHLSGKPLQWFKFGTEETPAKPDTDLLRVVIEAVEEGLDDLELELKPAKKAELIVMLYEMFQEEKKVDKGTVLRLIRLAA